MPTFFKRGTLPIVNDSSNDKSPRGGKCSNFPKTPRESFFNLVKDVSQLGSMVPSYPLIVKSSKFAKITCGRLCSSTMWWFVRVIFRSTFHFTSLHILDSNKIILLGHYYFHLVFNIPLSYLFLFSSFSFSLSLSHFFFSENPHPEAMFYW